MDEQERWGMLAGGVGLAPGGNIGPTNQLRVQCAMALQQLHGWLRATVPQVPQLAEAVPLTVQAVRMYRSAQFEACLAQIQTVVAQIDRLSQQNRPTP